MTRPTNSTLRAACPPHDPGRLRVRTREGEKRKRALVRARRRAAERWAAERRDEQ